MHVRFIPAIIVFLGSYLPLAVILLTQNMVYDDLKQKFCWPLVASQCELPLRDAHYSICLLVITLICFGITVFSLKLIRPVHDIDITEADYVPADLMNYTLPYIVSFMGVEYHDTNKFVGFCVFLTWMFLITYKAGQIFLNPLLIFFGWRLYDISYSFVGSTSVHKGRALVKGDLGTGRYKLRAVQDIQIIGT